MSVVPIEEHLQQVGLRLKELNIQISATLGAIEGRLEDAYAEFTRMARQVGRLERDHDIWAREYFLSSHVFLNLGSDAKEQAQAVSTDIGQSIARRRIWILLGIGETAMRLGRLDEAQRSATSGLDLCTPEPEFAEEKVQCLFQLASISFTKGAAAEADTYAVRSYDVAVSYSSWLSAAQALSVSASCALDLEDREVCESRLSMAILLTDTHGEWGRGPWAELRVHLEHFRDTVRRMPDFTGDSQVEVRQLADRTLANVFHEMQLQVNLSESSSELFLALPRIEEMLPGAVNSILDELRRRAAGNARKELEELRCEASFHEAAGRLTDAIQLSEQVLAKCREVHASQYELRRETVMLVKRRLASPDAAQRRLAYQAIDELASGGSDIDLSQALLISASTWLSAATAGRLDPDPAQLNDQQHTAALNALRDIQRADACDIEPAWRGIVPFSKAAICRVLGRDEEGLEASAEAIAYLRERLPVTTSLPPTQWTDRLASLEAIYGYRAEILIRQARLREAFECVDDGRAQLLRHQLAWANVKAGATPSGDHLSYAELQTLLMQESAALALFHVGVNHASVMIVDPREPEPDYQQISITQSYLASVLPQDPSQSAAKEQLFGALPYLSEKLLPPLRHIIQRYPLLYVVPSSELYAVPFAALKLDGAEYLVERCAVAYVPSASILKLCIERRRKEAGKRSFLALGVGGTKDAKGEPILFASQAKEVVDAVSKLPRVAAMLLPETTTAMQLLDQAQRADILHLECHGLLDRMANALNSSFLVLADNEHLTAQQIAQTPNQLSAEHVFLNSCLSGTFVRTIRNDAAGFWQAFFLAGIRSLTVTLSLVEPRSAAELAIGFYEHWLSGGLDKARALQAAQRNMIAKGVGPQNWATHILVGDHR